MSLSKSLHPKQPPYHTIAPAGTCNNLRVAWGYQPTVDNRVHSPVAVAVPVSVAVPVDDELLVLLLVLVPVLVSELVPVVVPVDVAESSVHVVELPTHA